MDINLIRELAEYTPLFVIAVGIVSIALIDATRKVLNAQSRERTRREIAAYIAEGSMTADQGERLMRAAPDGDASGDKCSITVGSRGAKA